MRIFCVEILQNVSNFKGNFKKNILQPENPVQDNLKTFTSIKNQPKWVL